MPGPSMHRCMLLNLLVHSQKDKIRTCELSLTLTTCGSFFPSHAVVLQMLKRKLYMVGTVRRWASPCTGVKNRQDLVLMKVCLLWCPQKREEFQVMSWNKADWNTGLGDDLQCRLYKQPNQTWSVLTLGGQTAWLLLLRKLLRFRNSNLTQLWHIRKQLPLIINYQNNQLQHYRKDHSMIFRISQTFL